MKVSIIIPSFNSEKIIINSINRMELNSIQYYTNIQKYQYNFTNHQLGIYMYSFALNPKDPNPTGYFDFSKTQSDKTFIKVNIKDNILYGPRNGIWNMHLYYTGYKSMKFQDGFMRFV